MDWVRLSKWRAAGLCLALVALILKAAVPAGFMLAPDAHDRMAIVLCSGHGPVAATLDLSTGEITEQSQPAGERDEHGKAKADSPCAFAIATQAGAALDGFVLPAPYVETEISPRPAREERQSRAPTGPPLPARGPPSFA